MAGVALLGLAIHHIDQQERIRRGHGRPSQKYWDVYYPPDKAFSVEMPGTSQEGQTLKTNLDVSYTVFTHVASDMGMAFGVAHYDRPANPRVNWTAEAVIAATRAMTLATIEKDEVREETVQICQRPALKISVLEKTSHIMHTFLVIPTEYRGYLLHVSGLNSLWDESLAERFLASFKFMESTSI